LQIQEAIHHIQRDTAERRQLGGVDYLIVAVRRNLLADFELISLRFHGLIHE